MTESTAAYSARASEYAQRFGSMSAVHPSDRQFVDSWATAVRGRVLDAGCGPGHWTNHLAGLGLDARGIDLAAPFLDHARAAYPRLRFALESIDDIVERDGALGGILSWFSTIHHEPAMIAVPLTEFARTLQPGGLLALGYFDGETVEPFEHAVVTAYRWPADALQRELNAVGFDVIETHRRTSHDQRAVAAILARRRATA